MVLKKRGTGVLDIRTATEDGLQIHLQDFRVPALVTCYEAEDHLYKADASILSTICCRQGLELVEVHDELSGRGGGQLNKMPSRSALLLWNWAARRPRSALRDEILANLSKTPPHARG